MILSDYEFLNVAYFNIHIFIFLSNISDLCLQSYWIWDKIWFEYFIKYNEKKWKTNHHNSDCIWCLPELKMSSQTLGNILSFVELQLLFATMLVKGIYIYTMIFHILSVLFYKLNKKSYAMMLANYN